MMLTGLLLFLSTLLIGQKFLVVENVNTLKNIKYYQGQVMMINFPGGHNRVSDQIYNLTDSSVIFEILGEVDLVEITCIYRDNWLARTLSGLGLIGGAAYLGIDSFNRMINHDNPVVLQETMIISGSLVAFGAALIPFRYRKIHTGEKWKLRTIDPDEF